MSEFSLYSVDVDISDAQKREYAVVAALQLIGSEMSHRQSGADRLSDHLENLSDYADKIQAALGAQPDAHPA